MIVGSLPIASALPTPMEHRVALSFISAPYLERKCFSLKRPYLAALRSAVPEPVLQTQLIDLLFVVLSPKYRSQVYQPHICRCTRATTATDRIDPHGRLLPVYEEHSGLLYLLKTSGSLCTFDYRCCNFKVNHYIRFIESFILFDFIFLLVQYVNILAINISQVL